MALVKGGYEVLRFPMKNLQMYQGCNGIYSHKGVNAIDCCGANSGIEGVYAPCRMKYITNDSEANGNAVYFQSVDKVLFANGRVDYATFMFIHANSLSDILEKARKGHIWKQWELFSYEGTAGYATGNHCHIEVAPGPYSHMYNKNSYGTYYLPCSMSPDKAFVVDDVKLFNNGQAISTGSHMDWKTFSQVPDPTTGVVKTETVVNYIPTDFIRETAKFTVTVDKIKIRRAPSLKGEDTNLRYSRGNSVNYDGYVKREDYVWISWIGQDGTRRWMAAGELTNGINKRPYGTFT